MRQFRPVRHGERHPQPWYELGLTGRLPGEAPVALGFGGLLRRLPPAECRAGRRLAVAAAVVFVAIIAFLFGAVMGGWHLLVPVAVGIDAALTVIVVRMLWRRDSRGQLHGNAPMLVSVTCARTEDGWEASWCLLKRLVPSSSMVMQRGHLELPDLRSADDVAAHIRAGWPAACRPTPRSIGAP